jgi:hypothetical protein
VESVVRHVPSGRLVGFTDIVVRPEKPEVTTLRTWNADTNVHMIAINERMGFRRTGWSREWAKDL